MWLRQRDAQIEEWLDAATIDEAALRLNLRDIRRINALLGWTTFTARTVVQQARQIGANAFTLLDICSGSADIPLAIARQAQRAGLVAHITATDLSPQIVAIARDQAAGTPTITIEEQDALRLPYAPSSFDIGLCTLALHHFAPEMAVALLRSLGRVARRVLIFDAERHPLAYGGVIIVTRLLPMHPMTRHDAPASVRRAYTAPEIADLARQAGLQAIWTRVDFPFRLILGATGTAAPSPPT